MILREERILSHIMVKNISGSLLSQITELSLVCTDPCEAGGDVTQIERAGSSALWFLTREIQRSSLLTYKALCFFWLLPP